jgi:YD repeat-containing protein
LNDLISKTYTNAPQVVIAYNKGWRTSVSVGGTVTYAYTTYDGLGRVTAASQWTAGQQYPFSYNYNLLDEVTSMTLPSGRVVATGYDNMGRPLNVTGTMASVTDTYVSGVSYAPARCTTADDVGEWPAGADLLQ